MANVTTNMPRKGRGAVSNESGRYEAVAREAFDDGWDLGGDPLPPLRTTVTIDRSKTIIARNTSPDLPFDRSINPYRGCEHGCVYCFARPTHAYLGLSPGLDFESKLFVKPQAAALLDAELRKPGYQCATLQLGSNTDPYQPLERKFEITRQILQVLDRFNHPVGITTKAAAVTRDLDILAPMAERSLAAVAISVTTLDRTLARKLEPRAPTPEKRLAAIRELSAAGIPVSIMVAPMIPALNDGELERIVEAGAAAGATAAHYTLLRLPLEISGLFEEWLETHAPLKAKHVLSLIRQCRDGGLNHAEFGTRFSGTGEYARLLSQRFRLARNRAGLTEASAADFQLRTDLFNPPPRPGDQLTLF
jgi:DNA repair photolyase